MTVHEAEGTFQQGPVEIEGGKVQAHAVGDAQLEIRVQKPGPGQHPFIPVAAHGFDAQGLFQEQHALSAAAAHVQDAVPLLPAAGFRGLQGQSFPAGVTAGVCVHGFVPFGKARLRL